MTHPDDGRAILRAVLEEPGEDAHRLVYADWLDERGGEHGFAAASFVRYAVRNPRRYQLWASGGDTLLRYRGGGGPCSPALAKLWEGTPLLPGFLRSRRGWIEGVSDLRAEAFLHSSDCLFRTQPVTRVSLLGYGPLNASYLSGGAGVSYPEDRPWLWPPGVWQLLPVVADRIDSGFYGWATHPKLGPAGLEESLRSAVGGKFYRTERAAREAFSAALVRWGRARAGLPEIET